MIVNLISSPRNISTATMYAFANHGAFKVMDEPFYAYYLQLTGADHPGKEEIIQSQPTSVQGVLEWIHDSQKLNQHLFIKNMAHHLIDMDLNFLQDYTNVLLIRDPKQLITSFAKVIPNPKMSDIGVKRQYEIYQFLGEKCIVLDSNEVLKNPENVLKKLFDNLEIPFSATMMQWEPGAIAEDGVWAKYWYDSVHQSSGFSKKITSNPAFPKHCLALLEESMPYYSQLHQKAIKAD
ncbi:sulfotransferase family protein [Marinoscillum sp.]|uniref:sulfotransferase-like domain-containing protein n=1 Tax=Marinoscillum sp. TaxID=2024838 RepID=UPI003BAD27AB